LSLLGQDGRDMLGAWVEIEAVVGLRQAQRVRTAGSYASARDPRLVFGLGKHSETASVMATWPSGERERWPALPAKHRLVLVESSAERGR
jgi:hypothetical protein